MRQIDSTFREYRETKRLKEVIVKPGLRCGFRIQDIEHGCGLDFENALGFVGRGPKKESFCFGFAHGFPSYGQRGRSRSPALPRVESGNTS